MVSWLEKLENIEKAGTHVNNYKFVNDSSIRETLFKGKLQILRGKIILNCYLH